MSRGPGLLADWTPGVGVVLHPASVSRLFVEILYSFSGRDDEQCCISCCWFEMVVCSLDHTESPRDRSEGGLPLLHATTDPDCNYTRTIIFPLAQYLES